MKIKGLSGIGFRGPVIKEPSIGSGADSKPKFKFNVGLSSRLKYADLNAYKRVGHEQLSDVLDDLIESNQWDTLVKTIEVFGRLSVIKKSDLSAITMYVKERASSYGEFNIVIRLLQFFKNSAFYTSKEMLDDIENELKRYEKLKISLTEYTRDVNESLWTVEMKVINCIIEHDQQRIQDILMKTKGDAQRIFEITHAVINILDFIKKNKRIYEYQITEFSELGRFLTNFLLNRWISKDRIHVVKI